jgi:hypothetical protein
MGLVSSKCSVMKRINQKLILVRGEIILPKRLPYANSSGLGSVKTAVTVCMALLNVINQCTLGEKESKTAQKAVYFT